MAQERVYKVIIDGVEYVSKAAKEASEGVNTFVGKMKGWFKSFVDFKAAWDMLSGAARKLYDVARESLGAYDEYIASLRKLEGTAKITGIPLGELVELSNAARQKFALSAIVANDLAVATANLAGRTGQAVDKQELLAAVLNMGAARGLTATESLESFERAIMGIDAGFDKLYGKNQSVIFQEYAAEIGTTVGKLTDMEKGQALVWATMKAGDAVGEAYVEFLQSSAGQQDVLNTRVQEAKVRFGSLVSPIRDAVVRGLNLFMDSSEGAGSVVADLTRMVSLLVSNGIGVLHAAFVAIRPLFKVIEGGVWVMTRSFMFFGDAIRAIQIVFQMMASDLIRGTGFLVEKVGGLLKKFGVDVVADTGSWMSDWGNEMKKGSRDGWDQFRRDSTAAWSQLGKDVDLAVPRVTDGIGKIGGAADKALGADVPAASKKAGKAIADNLGPTVQDLLGVTEQSMKDLAKTASTTLEPTKAKAFNGEMGHLITKAHEVRDRLMGWTPEIEKTTGKGKDLTREVGTIARGALDLAQSFGVVDAQAASLLNSVVNIAAALPRALAGDLTSIGGIIGGVANIAKQITGGDAARRKLLADNTRSLERLSKEVSGLRMNVTGESFASVKSVLEKVVPNLKLGGIQNFGSDMMALASAMQAGGITMNDLEAVAKALGINLKDSNGNFVRNALPQLLQAMGMVNPTTIGGGFSDALDQMLTGFSVRGTGGMAQLSSLFGLAASQGASALSGIFDPSNLAGTRAGLLGLFDQLEAGTLDPSQLGGLTGQQFRDFIVDLIGRTDDLMQDSGGGSGNAPVSDGEVVPTGSVPTGTAPSPALTLADVFRDYASESLPLFTQQIALQTRIADATEATAENTALTVDEVRALRMAIEGGSFIDGIDRALGERRALEVQRSGIA
jgi:hypothetical protein